MTDKTSTCASRELLRSAEILHVYGFLTDSQYGTIAHKIKLLYEDIVR